MPIAGVVKISRPAGVNARFPEWLSERSLRSVAGCRSLGPALREKARVFRLATCHAVARCVRSDLDFESLVERVATTDKGAYLDAALAALNHMSHAHSGARKTRRRPPVPVPVLVQALL
jgi:hypothetical protein